MKLLSEICFKGFTAYTCIFGFTEDRKVAVRQLDFFAVFVLDLRERHIDGFKHVKGVGGSLCRVTQQSKHTLTLGIERPDILFFKIDLAAALLQFADGREDVLTFLSPVLEQDVTVAGGVDAELFVTLSQTDADFVVKVIDVGPDGEYESLVRFNIMRGRYRNSLSKPEPFKVGEVERVAFELPDIAHTFMAGHRIKVQVQSSWFPLFDRNPQQYINIYEAKDEDYLPCDVKIYHSVEYPSSITLRIME